MLQRLRARLTYANVMATIAVFAAIGGGAIAVGAIPDGKGRINGCYVKKGKSKGQVRLLVSGTKCRRGEAKVTWNQQGPAGLTGAPGVAGAPGDRGAQGEQGVQGVQGAAGTARAYALIRPSTCDGSGTCTAERAKGVSAVKRVATGIYCITVSGIDAREVAAVASVDYWNTSSPEGNASAMTTSANDTGVVCPNDTTEFVVYTERQPGQTVDKAGGSENETVSDLAVAMNDVAFVILVP